MAGEQRRVTAADVARSLGLSRATVGFVLNNTPGQTIPESTRHRVIVEAGRLGYRPHRAARALASGQSRIVLLVLPDWPIDHSMRVHLDEASAALDRAGYSLVTTTSHRDGQAPPLWDTLGPDAVMGLVPFDAVDLDRIRASGVRHIIPDVPAGVENLPEALRFSAGPRLQVEHLLERGRRRLAFAGSPDPRVADLVATRRALARATYHAATGADLVADADVTADTIADTIAAWTELAVDGIVAYNDDTAALVTGAIIRAGIRVPSDFAVIGHDDTPLAELFLPSLSSVRVDSAGLGRYLADLALSVITGSNPPIAGPETAATVVARESS